MIFVIDINFRVYNLNLNILIKYEMYYTFLGLHRFHKYEKLFTNKNSFKNRTIISTGRKTI